MTKDGSRARMLTLILGGAGSGKSEYGENFAGKAAEKGAAKIYLATMEAYDLESRQRIQKHRLQREGKGFTTIEMPRNLQSECIPEGSVVLLECLSNLVANEMFQGNEIIPEEEIVLQIWEELKSLEKRAERVIIISNQIFSDGIDYDTGTKAYQKALGELHQKISQCAEQVIEIVCGIPIFLKGGIT